MTDEVVTRLYRALVAELQRRGHPDDEGVRVSDIYQDLVPYAAVRGTLGVELNADYEDAMLRLLAGERDLVRLESDQAREELQREVNAPYPFVGLYRKFGASRVRVTMPASEVPGGQVELTDAHDIATAGGTGAAAVRLHRSTPDADITPQPDIEAPATSRAVCTFCAGQLPPGRRVRFCPHCGGDQRLQLCPRCDSVLELGWRYCISCGHVAPSD
jgi:hypothetical protein